VYEKDYDIVRSFEVPHGNITGQKMSCV